MIQAIAVLITGGLIVGGLVGTDVIGDDGGAQSQVTAAAAPATDAEPEPSSESDPSEEPALSGQPSGGSGAGDEQGGSAPSGQGKASGAAPAGGSQADVDRFCTTTQRLQRASRQFFSRRQGQGGPPEPAQDRFLEQSQKLIDAARQQAPASVRNDVNLIITELRAGPDQAPNPSQVKAAQRSIIQFERKNC